MPSSALVFAGAIETRSDQGASRKVRAASQLAVQQPAELPQTRSRYRAKAWTGGLFATAVTIALHLLVIAVVIYGWGEPKKTAAPDKTIVVTLLPLAPDEPTKRQERGTVAAEAPPMPALAEMPASIVKLSVQAPVVPAEPVSEPSPIPADGGKDEQLAQIAQAYREAIMAQLAAERSYPHRALLAGHQGKGAILFHIDREGRLLDLAIETSTGRKALDRAALALVRRAAPFPTVPAEMPDLLEVSLPIRFLIVPAGTMVAAR